MDDDENKLVDKDGIKDDENNDTAKKEIGVNTDLNGVEKTEKTSNTFLYIYKDPEFFKKFNRTSKNDFFEKSPKTKKIIFFDFFQDFQNLYKIKP